MALMSLTSLWEAAGQGSAAQVFHTREQRFALAELRAGSTLDGRLEDLRGRNVVLATRDQLGSAIALLELDGVAARIVLCTPDLSAAQLAAVASAAAADFIVQDGRDAQYTLSGETLPTGLARVLLTPLASAPLAARRASESTEWVLLTSGTTGNPKLVVHTLESLAGGLPRSQAPDATNAALATTSADAAAAERPVWSTFYDIRRYGGLQIYLRAVLGGASLVLSSVDEAPAEFFARGAAAGVTHISGTPSHWRRALMSGATSVLKPGYVRLSGEIPDQTVLDSLQAAFPNSRIGHAFASTEAGVVFDVNDGLAGFPAEYLTQSRSGVEMQIRDGTLRIRSRRTASHYLGSGAAPLRDPDGWVDTGDLVESSGERCFFRGRKTGVINVGGLKVHPEEVESILNGDARVRMSLVRARRNPITGAVVVADVVLTASAQALDPPTMTEIKEELLAVCRRALPAYKVPSQLRFVPALDLTPAGKLVRAGA